MLVAASHLVIGLVGAVLLYVALFLRETEEGQLQNRLEKLWVDIDDLSRAALSRQTAFLQQISAMTSSGLSRLFGVRLWSAGAVATSVSFSVGSVVLFLTTADYSVYLNIALPIAGIILFVLGFSPLPFRYLGLVATENPI